MYKISKLAAGSAILATAALGSAGVALADGYAPKGRVVYERPADWSGVYFGVSSGYQWSSIDVVNPAAPPGYNAENSSSFVGTHLGLQHQFGNIVLGIEGNWASTFRDSEGGAPCPGAGFSCYARLNDVLSVGPRIGWAAGHWMPYVTGGYANAAFHHTARTIPTGVMFEEAHARLSGWYIGGGVEWIVSPGWTVGLEYRHYDFEDDIVAGHSPAGVFLEPVRFDATTDTVSARVSWRWGRPEARPLK